MNYFSLGKYFCDYRYFSSLELFLEFMRTNNFEIHSNFYEEVVKPNFDEVLK